MKEKAAKIKEIIEKHRDEIKKHGSGIFYDFFVKPSRSNPEGFVCMELMIGPLSLTDATYRLAKKIAEDYGIKLTTYDFSRGEWSEPRDYRTVFSITVPDNESEFENTVTTLIEARKKLNKITEPIIKS